MKLPSGAPLWGDTAVNITYQPISGISKIAYVDPVGGNDGTGTVATWTSGSYRVKPGGINAFATGDAAIAAVAVAANGAAFERHGPHAVLFANSDSGAVHTTPVVNGGCAGLSTAHPWYFGVYWPSGTAGTTVESNMALFDPGLGPHSEFTMFSVQRSGGFSNLIIEGLAFKQQHRISGDAAYDQTDATTLTNFLRAFRMSGGGHSNIVLRNILVQGTTEGIIIEAVGHQSQSLQLHNVVLDKVIVKDVWAPSGTYEGIFMYGCRRPRIINSVVLGCGHNRHDLSLGEGDTALGRNQGIYFNFCEEPWVHNGIIAHNSHAGIQARCGGYITSCLFWANARNLGFGHGQNTFELKTWPYACAAHDNVFWGSRNVGAGYPNPSSTPLAIGDGVGCGRVDNFDGQRNIFVGDPHYASTDNTFAIRVGTRPSGTGVYRHASSIVYNWPPSGVSASGAVWIESGTVANTTVKVEGVRFYQTRAALFYVDGDEPTNRRRLEAGTIKACRRETSGSATLYGPSGSAPSNLTSGALTGTIRRSDSWGGTAPELWQAVGGYADEEALITAMTKPGSKYDARHVLNIIRSQPQFQPMSAIPDLYSTLPNQAYTG